ncbi:Serine/threonine-protein kinase env7 [Sporothrix epigloea]|uniref:non-specific serine/threonine protein kinase n=1 Tax=Sporothrix epigloea TaxID=1892477 RepID=A0ABP0DRY9_9PEZI
MATALLDLIYSMGSCLSCFPSTPTLKVNGRSFKILRLLGEGGFSYVYLVQDNATAELFALKKIRCPFGAESVAQAMREVEAYRLFAGAEGIIHSVDHSVATERGGGGTSGVGDSGGGPAKTVYIVLPYYRRGNLQDLINANLVNHTQFPEKQLLQLFLGICRALREMHKYQSPAARSTGAGSTADERMAVPPARAGKSTKSAKAAKAAKTAKATNNHTRPAGADDELEAEQQRPLMAGEESRVGNGKSYAHRDIKPGNIMIADDGTTPILMDLGSIADSPLAITSRSLAIATQDVAAEHSTMPYRAPELFDVKTGGVVDTKVDIWSMGATLFACLVGKSPFEMRSDETGGSLAICVLSGDWRFPDEGPGGTKQTPKPKRTGTGMSASGSAAAAAVQSHDPTISEPVREVVRRCLRVEPAERPDIDELIQLVEDTLEQLE